MTEWFEFIKNVGFPMAIAVFVLWRLDATLRKLVDEVRGFGAALSAGRKESVEDIHEKISDTADRIVVKVDQNMRDAIERLTRPWPDRNTP